ncbi:efflux RND transporter periplasmic adaptor subunit [Adhaeribacter sp. BT258]|uniref:Efflux RND transporter periplasmic adaptor subunit n=1 Tax=Adhaeribacter terrigena TaxID=2793070 RepID=A0ABS1C0R6_9BACT|nr:efflux RND transporter periplasmic adaptor subunit [Adhaeribacter terrigena]MBK0402977.1 efflux RND transporter periplasmic adaptor subunit [Adhaeribacter terrigena]
MRNIFLLLGIGLLVACSSTPTETRETPKETAANLVTLTPAQLKNFELTMQPLQKKIIPYTIKLNGTADLPPQNLVSVSNALGGYVKATSLIPGKPFKKGDVLALMEDNQYIELQQEYLTTKAKLKMTEAEFERQRDLNQSKATSDKAFQQAAAEFQANKIALQALSEKLKLISINPQTLSSNAITRTIKLHAPFNGYVAKVNVNVGKYASPSDVLFELVNPQNLLLNLKVFEKDISRLAPGQSVVAYTNTNPEKKYAGEIIFTGRTFAADRSVEVHANLKNSLGLVPGAYVNAEIEQATTESWAVPEEAVVSFEGKDFLFVAKGKDSFELVPAETGVTGNNWTEIKNAAAFEGKNVVFEGAYTLLMALKNSGEEE